MSKKYIHNGIEYEIGDVVIFSEEAVEMFVLPKNIAKIVNFKKVTNGAGFGILIDWNSEIYTMPSFKGWDPDWFSGKLDDKSAKAYDTLFSND